MELIKSPKHGDRLLALDTCYPSELLVVGRSNDVVGDANGTTYGYVLTGQAEVAPLDPRWSARLGSGGYFSVPGRFKLEVGDGLVVLITRHGFRGQLVSGALEKRGRLSYIDGCSDSLLVYPPRQGDPCFNHLHFPPGIHQTQHTHPSIRVGIVTGGNGQAFRVPSAGNSGWEKDLTTGCVFLLPEQEQHSFRTKDETMDVVAFHPDSDWGPTDAAHPMRNRTYIGNDRTGLAGG